jgi:hypothetical protein
MKPMKVVCSLLMCSLLAACVHPAQPPNGTAATTETGGSGPCMWSWNTRPLPEVSAQVQAAMLAAGLSEVEASASAFGEDCLDPRTNQVRRFATMQTDFYVKLAVPSLADLNSLGDLAERVLGILDDFPPGTVPGPQTGYLELIFVAGGEDTRLWFRLPRASEARQQGLHGQALLEALGY